MPMRMVSGHMTEKGGKATVELFAKAGLLVGKLVWAAMPSTYKLLTSVKLADFYLLFGFVGQIVPNFLQDFR